MQKTKQRYQDMISRDREGRKGTEVRHKIQKLVDDLNGSLTNPTEKKHIPRELTTVMLHL